MYNRYYAKQATTIQKWWRGYFVRSRIFNYYALKRWLLAVQAQNELLVKIMTNYRLTTEAELMKQMEEDAEKWVQDLLIKLHHHLRTAVRPGIYSKRGTSKLSPLEVKLKELKFRDYVDDLHQQRREMRKEYERRPRSPPPEGHHQHCREFWYKRTRANQPSLLGAEKFKDEKMLRKERNEKQKEKDSLWIHEKPMQFPIIRYDDNHLRMDHSTEEKQMVFKSIHPDDFKIPWKSIKFFDELETPDVGGPFLSPPESKMDLVIRRHREKCLDQESNEDN